MNENQKNEWISGKIETHQENAKKQKETQTKLDSMTSDGARKLYYNSIRPHSVLSEKSIEYGPTSESFQNEIPLTFQSVIEYTHTCNEKCF